MKVFIIQTKTTNIFPMNIGSLLIRLIQRTNYSHYVVLIKIGNREPWVYESRFTGTKRSRATDFFKKNKMVKQYYISNKFSYVDFGTFFKKHEGKRYSLLQLLGLFCMKALKVFKTNPFGTGAKALICNEFVLLMLNHFGYTNVQDTDDYDLNDTQRILDRLFYDKR